MHPFFAVLSRMKHIRRWGLMRCTREENLCEHSFETAVLAHALAVLRNERFGGHVSPERAATPPKFSPGICLRPSSTTTPRCASPTRASRSMPGNGCFRCCRGSCGPSTVRF